MTSQVRTLTIDDILGACSKGDFQLPLFQRDFVWRVPQIIALAESALRGMPCGSLVTWHESEMQADPVRIRSGNEFINFCNSLPKPDPARKLVIDGLQRLTAICVVFGGLKHTDGRQWLAGKFFIDMEDPDIAGSIKFFKDSEIKNKKLDDPGTWERDGLYPLNQDQSYLKGPVSNIWAVRMTQITGENLKLGGVRGDKATALIQSATNPAFMEITIPAEFSLGDVSDNFELLNTAGTPVSVVDITHSVLFDWWQRNRSKEFLLRKWIEDISESEPDSLGWGTADRRQLIAQLVVATELSLEKRAKHHPRAKHKQAASVKNRDILGLSEQHWADVVDDTSQFKEAIRDFQMCVLGARFPAKSCPYPISAGIYVGLWWRLSVHTAKWTKNRLDNIFRAFFWNNVLSGRYDQGFLTLMATDMSAILTLLEKHESDDEATWKASVTKWLTEDVEDNPPDLGGLVAKLNLHGATGAMKDALELPVKYLPQSDLLDPKSSVAYEKSPATQLHHIFPKKWIKKNFTINNFSSWHTTSDAEARQKAIQNCIANQTPLTDVSNLKWSDASPSSICQTMEPTVRNVSKSHWQERFITTQEFRALEIDNAHAFLEKRAERIAQWILDAAKMK